MLMSSMAMGANPLRHSHTDVLKLHQDPSSKLRLKEISMAAIPAGPFMAITAQGIFRSLQPRSNLCRKERAPAPACSQP